MITVVANVLPANSAHLLDLLSFCILIILGLELQDVKTKRHHRDCLVQSLSWKSNHVEGCPKSQSQ